MDENRSRFKLEALFPILLVTAISLQLVISVLTYVRLSSLSRNILQIAAQSGAKGYSSIQQGLPSGTRAPGFVLNDTTGKPVSLENFIGRKVLLMFSSPTCPACIRLYADLKLFQEQNTDVQVVMISYGSIEENKKLVAEQSFSFPVLSWLDSIAMDYKVTGTPALYAVDEEGIIRSSGWMSDLGEIEKLFGGR